MCFALGLTALLLGFGTKGVDGGRLEDDAEAGAVVASLADAGAAAMAVISSVSMGIAERGGVKYRPSSSSSGSSKTAIQNYDAPS